MKILTAKRMDRCIGCHSCSLACARLVHGLFSWITAGIHIRTSGGLSTGYEASLCLACEPAACAAVCPTGACTQRAGGGVKKNPELCVRCGACVSACPVRAVHVDAETHLPYVCLHCGRCVPFCPHNCLSMEEAPPRDAGQPVSSQAVGAQASPSASAPPAPVADAAENTQEAGHAD